MNTLETIYLISLVKATQGHKIHLQLSEMVSIYKSLSETSDSGHFSISSLISSSYSSISPYSSKNEHHSSNFHHHKPLKTHEPAWQAMSCSNKSMAELVLPNFSSNGFGALDGEDKVLSSVVPDCRLKGVHPQFDFGSKKQNKIET